MMFFHFFVFCTNIVFRQVSGPDLSIFRVFFNRIREGVGGGGGGQGRR